MNRNSRLRGPAGRVRHRLLERQLRRGKCTARSSVTGSKSSRSPTSASSRFAVQEGAARGGRGRHCSARRPAPCSRASTRRARRSTNPSDAWPNSGAARGSARSTRRVPRSRAPRAASRRRRASTSAYARWWSASSLSDSNLDQAQAHGATQRARRATRPGRGSSCCSRARAPSRSSRRRPRSRAAAPRWRNSRRPRRAMSCARRAPALVEALPVQAGRAPAGGSDRCRAAGGRRALRARLRAGAAAGRIPARRRRDPARGRRRGAAIGEGALRLCRGELHSVLLAHPEGPHPAQLPGRDHGGRRACRRPAGRRAGAGHAGRRP